MSVAVNFFENVELGDDEMKVLLTNVYPSTYCVFTVSSL